MSALGAVVAARFVAKAAVALVSGVVFVLILVVVLVGSLLGQTLSFGPPVNLGPISPPASIVTLDKQVAAASHALVPCTVSASLLLAQQWVESGYQPTATSSAGAQGLAQFLPKTFAKYANPVPPGGATPPTPFDPTDAAYAEARYLCSLGVVHNPVDALIAYNCGNTSATCVAASSGYAAEVLQLAQEISTPTATTNPTTSPTTTPTTSLPTYRS